MIAPKQEPPREDWSFAELREEAEEVRRRIDRFGSRSAGSSWPSRS